MNQIINLQLSEFSLFLVLVAGLLLFIILRLLSRALMLVPAHRAYRTVMLRLFPALEAVSWLFFALWSAGVLFDEHLYHTLALLTIMGILVILISWFAVKDWIAGVILKAQDVYERNQYIQLSDIRGRISHMGYLAMEIEQENGDLVRIPYSKISGQIHCKHHPEALSNFYRFQVAVPRTASLADATHALRTAILNSPWSSMHRAPRIALHRESDQSYVFEAVVYAPRREFAQSIEDDVKRQYPDITLER